MTSPLRVGLVGAGPHAVGFHAPMWAAGPETRLAGWWSRRPEMVREVASSHGAEVVDSFAELLERSDAIALAVPPAAQWSLAIEAANAGKHLLLEKPIADTVAHARDLVDAVEDAGIGSVVLFTARFVERVRVGLDRVRGFDVVAARGVMLTGLLLDVHATPWRRAHGALFDLGPHVIDLATAALGRATRVTAHRSRRGWIDLQIDHDSGARSNLAVTGHVAPEAVRYAIQFYGSDGYVEIDVWAALDEPQLMSAVRAELVSASNGGLVLCNARRGLLVHEALDAAQRSIERGGVVTV